MIGVTSEITLKRTLYIDEIEGESEEDTIKRAKQEIILPHNALYMAADALNRTGIRIDKLDLKDWEVDNCEFKIIQSENE